MKKMILIAVAMILVASVASAATIVGTKHDMRTYGITGMTTTQVCVFCHTPHQMTGQTTLPLWNHTLSTATYAMYSSPTMSAAPAGASLTGAYSALCLSCHDGTVAVNAVSKQPRDGSAGTQTLIQNLGAPATGVGNLGTDLSNDHPINIVYNNGDTKLKANPVDANNRSLLYNSTIQCGSCHDAHDTTIVPFLRMSNANSALCLTCHNK